MGFDDYYVKVCGLLDTIVSNKEKRGLFLPGEVWGEKPSLTFNLGTNGLKVTSGPPLVSGRAGCMQGLVRFLLTNLVCCICTLLHYLQTFCIPCRCQF